MNLLYHDFRYQCDGIKCAIMLEQCTDKYTARHKVNVPAENRVNRQVDKAFDSRVKVTVLVQISTIFTTTPVR